MKLVLLPGLDGTGLLFKEFISFYEGESIVIALPIDSQQDYKSLANSIKNKLPQDNFILLAESFSGGLVPHLLQLSGHHIKGLIFVASFLNTPNKALLTLASTLPITKFATLPTATYVHRRLFLGMHASPYLVSKFVEVIKSVPEAVLRKRMKSILELKNIRMTTSIPTAYIQATDDKLVNTGNWNDFQKIFTNIKLYRIEGPHFILQSKPFESAKTVSEIIMHLTRTC
ncbi:MAG: lysophospholipase [Candidatus Thiodiazotropha sp. (ex Lucinoma borealis)]|nr:lysophospholipase [Candidatus Thiodiazotropha sp. (ex Lucinoma borealis)]MCU7857208.1 lysophospholipase [Candidatus Thiodiazotropha sp. (ex Lucinoma borealis)]MCU7869770.1 lysophospholipase [Candidatus Thiodiazotropha sp. (ex Lucinoma borealis)]